MISDKQVDKFLNKALSKMFQCVGLKYTEKFTKQHDWYLLHAWDDATIAKYKTWFITQARKHFKWTKARAEREWGYFFLMWGWKQHE
jgi:hypothetical protein